MGRGTGDGGRGPGARKLLLSSIFYLLLLLIVPACRQAGILHSAIYIFHVEEPAGLSILSKRIALLQLQLKRGTWYMKNGKWKMENELIQCSYSHSHS
ncbi:MAG: hypothetical protein KAH26_06995, partial [Bacteroidales bacterium]|nr:hypothetical protein [Bacteroidales bacterium]